MLKSWSAGVLPAVLLVGLASTGCSFFRPADQQVVFDTTPRGATLFVDGIDRGPGPIMLTLRRDTTHVVEAATDTVSYTRELHPRLSVTGGLDMVGGSIFLVPGLGLLAPGAYDLDSDSVTLPLDRRPPATTRPAASTQIVTVR